MYLKLFRIMKRFLLLFSLVILIGCSCLSQIPPVTGYVDVNCEATLPDFTVLVTVSDNCDAATLAQIPVAGTIVGKGITKVVVAAMDESGNTKSVNASFIALDTISPIITIDETAFLYLDEDVYQMYRTFACWTQYNKDVFLTECSEFDTINNEYIPSYVENSIFNNSIAVPDPDDTFNCYVASELP